MCYGCPLVLIVGNNSARMNISMSRRPDRLPCRMRPALAMSQDGRNWARIEGSHHSGALLDVGEEGDWDATMACAPQVPPPLLPGAHQCLPCAHSPYDAPAQSPPSG